MVYGNGGSINAAGYAVRSDGNCGLKIAVCYFHRVGGSAFRSYLRGRSAVYQHSGSSVALEAYSPIIYKQVASVEFKTCTAHGSGGAWACYC